MRHCSSRLPAAWFCCALFFCALAVVAALSAHAAESAPAPAQGRVAIVIHGGAGTILPENMTPELETRYRETLREGLDAGYAILAEGGDALDAVIAAIRVYEESPLFNAGKGAVFTAAGRNELDASIMVGSPRAAGAVAGVTRIRSPILAARAVMERTDHVMLAGEGAEAFAAEEGLELVDRDFFFTQQRWDALERARRKEAEAGTGTGAKPSDDGAYFGTVGAVALDRSGRLVAGTSTGGMTNKSYGRIGDSPIIGAGTWADERCAVSATGHGEFFIRHAVAHDICARVAYTGATIEEAADEVVHQVLEEAGGTGGVIALGSDGSLAMTFNTPGMYRGYVREGEEPTVEIFR